MAVKAKMNKRAGLSVKTQAFINNVIAPDNAVKFTDDDYTIIDFLERTQKNSGDFVNKTKGRPCCWDVIIRIATTPSQYVTPEYLEYIKNGNFQHWSEANCDIAELYYHHEGMATFDVIHIVASKIFLEFVDPKTHLLEAQVRIRPMTLTDRIKKYGPFKTVVDMHDKLDINYFFDGSLEQNADLFTRPLTNM